MKEKGMTKILLTNSATGEKKLFWPEDTKDVRMYVCGPTVYDRAHIGNARPVVVFDLMFRLLRHQFGEMHVHYARNFTDVDDKINVRAAETGRTIREITDETIAWFHEDMGALGALRPTLEPRATDYIGAMLTMVTRLVEKGHAYERDGHVFFRVSSLPSYGSLSGRTTENMKAGARVEISGLKDDPMDFVLWKPSGIADPAWDSPWGPGRPGWHIECSAMAQTLFGETFDIHGGGRDLMFPHHENERAQSCAAHGHENYAGVWMHNEMVRVSGGKMSKSLGNFITVRQLLDQGWQGDEIRMVLMSAHYRKVLDWSDEKLEQARQTLQRWRQKTAGLKAPKKYVPDASVYARLANDLDTPGVIARLHELEKEERFDDLLAAAQWVGLLGENGKLLEISRDVMHDAIRIGAIIDAARKSGDFRKVDELKAALADRGAKVQIGRDQVIVDEMGAILKVDINKEVEGV